MVKLGLFRERILYIVLFPGAIRLAGKTTLNSWREPWNRILQQIDVTMQKIWRISCGWAGQKHGCEAVSTNNFALDIKIWNSNQFLHKYKRRGRRNVSVIDEQNFLKRLQQSEKSVVSHQSRILKTWLTETSGPTTWVRCASPPSSSSCFSASRWRTF